MEEQILAALDQLISKGSWLASALAAAIILSWIVFALLFSRQRSYHDEKGKNLATKEDVAELTRLAEQVRHEFESLREASSQKNRLQLAALDRRLEAHQAAFRVWHLLAKAYGATDAGKAGKVSDDQVPGALAAWNELWERQSLYLDAETRAAVHSLPRFHTERVSKIDEHRKSLPLFGSQFSVTPADRRRDAGVEASMLQSKLRGVDEEIRRVLALIEQGVHLPALREEGGSTE